MALCGVAQLVDGLDSGVHGSVVADGVLAAGDIIVDGAGQANAGNALIGQRTGALKEPSPPMTTSESMPSSLQRASALAWPAAVLNSRQRAVYRMVPPRLDNFGNAADVHVVALTVDQAVVTALDTHHTVAFGDTGTHNGTNCCIHAGCVAAAGPKRQSF